MFKKLFAANLLILMLSGCGFLMDWNPFTAYYDWCQSSWDEGFLKEHFCTLDYASADVMDNVSHGDREGVERTKEKEHDHPNDDNGDEGNGEAEGQE